MERRIPPGSVSGSELISNVCKDKYCTKDQFAERTGITKSTLYRHPFRYTDYLATFCEEADFPIDYVVEIVTGYAAEEASIRNKLDRMTYDELNKLITDEEKGDTPDHRKSEIAAKLMAEKANPQKIEEYAKARIQQARALAHRGYPDEELKVLEEGRNTYRRFGGADVNLMTRFRTNIANAYFLKGDHDTALDLLIQLREYIRRLNDSELLQREFYVNYLLALVYIWLSAHPASMTKKQAYENARRSIGRAVKLSKKLGEEALVEPHLRELDAAQIFVDVALGKLTPVRGMSKILDSIRDDEPKVKQGSNIQEALGIAAIIGSLIGVYLDPGYTALTEELVDKARDIAARHRNWFLQWQSLELRITRRRELGKPIRVDEEDRNLAINLLARFRNFSYTGQAILSDAAVHNC